METEAMRDDQVAILGKGIICLSVCIAELVGVCNSLIRAVDSDWYDALKGFGNDPMRECYDNIDEFEAELKAFSGESVEEPNEDKL